MSYGEFLNDPEQVEERLHFPVLKELVRQRIEANEAGIDLSIMDHMAGTEIVTAIAHAIPLSAAERQVLMETPDLQELEGVLLQTHDRPRGAAELRLPDVGAELRRSAPPAVLEKGNPVRDDLADLGKGEVVGLGLGLDLVLDGRSFSLQRQGVGVAGALPGLGAAGGDLFDGAQNLER